ncbi:MAG: hypothetical protein PHP62_00235 [Candidatus Moranbacteria bacterium]|nr:hypothetical protein [Candidatus Moranbacteria bacterium]
MNNVLKQLSIIVAELLASKEFWKELLLCTETEHNVLFHLEASCGRIIIKLSLCDAMEWLTYFGRSADETETEAWQRQIRQYLTMGMSSVDTTEYPRFSITLPSSKFADPTIIFIPDSSEENALTIKIDAPGASCDAGGDGYGRD